MLRVKVRARLSETRNDHRSASPARSGIAAGTAARRPRAAPRPRAPPHSTDGGRRGSGGNPHGPGEPLGLPPGPRLTRRHDGRPPRPGCTLRAPPAPPDPTGPPRSPGRGDFSLSLSLCGPEPPPAAVPTPVPPPADAAPLSLPAPPLTATAPAPPAPRYAPRAAPDRIENQSGAMNAVSAPGRGWDPGSPSCGRPACGSARGWVSFEVPPDFSHSLMCRAARTLLCKRRGWFVHGQLSDRPWDPSLLHLASPALGMKGG